MRSLGWMTSKLLFANSQIQHALKTSGLLNSPVGMHFAEITHNIKMYFC